MIDEPAATDETSEPPVSRGVRRRASRPAGSAASTEAPAALDMAIPSTAGKATAEPGSTAKAVRAAVQVPRRQPHRTLVTAIGLAVAAVLVAALAGGTWFLWHGNGKIEATQDRDQRFVDTAKQTVVNMFSYTQNTIDESVNRFVGGIGPGPLRDMMNQNNNAENLKYLFKQTQANSEAVITSAALESIDNTSNVAKVLVTVRVTLADLNGVNQPSTPYRQRVFIREDDGGHMSAYDIKYPDGGN
ncbi:mammalian cell entry protein [Mycobacterium sp. CBMA 234]|uniref:mammalian cell entry protein n=1 Tax=Mycolicibacterium sp. CBMA 234 TaxID=1918495 RepID=UPI0012DE0E81|nr:mammalian cell entry protein [Mycolicibacterium sp. CBMA 234]MUL66330.1 mammalian cell entry protein [Mycolicibacterium sp. CBMA 234]